MLDQLIDTIKNSNYLPLLEFDGNTYEFLGLAGDELHVVALFRDNVYYYMNKYDFEGLLKSEIVKIIPL